MTRRMSVQMTLPAVVARIKTETRRHKDTWKNLEPGDHLVLIEKGMGLPKGAKQVVVATVEILDNYLEPLSNITPAGVAAEGFTEMTPDEFIQFWLDGHKVRPFATVDELMTYEVRVIRWRYLNPGLHLDAKAA